MSCYKLADGVLHAAEDPIGDGDGSGGYEQAIYSAGYLSEFSSMTHQSTGAEITVYSTKEKSKPMFYIDVTGRIGQLAVLVADDFPALLATLKELNPLISLMALDQQADLQAELILAREEK